MKIMKKNTPGFDEHQAKEDFLTKLAFFLNDKEKLGNKTIGFYVNNDIGDSYFIASN